MSHERINSNIAMVRVGGMESNVYIVNGELLIDATSGFSAKALLDEFGHLDMKFADIKRLVATHAHFDHMGGHFLFPSAVVGAHSEDAEILEKGDDSMSCAFYFSGQLKKRDVELRLNDGDFVRVGKLKLEIIHTPGHTKGSICLYEPEAKILFSGDLIFDNAIGRTDLFGGSSRELKESLEKISKKDVKIILPGHGKPVTENANEHIRKMIAIL